MVDDDIKDTTVDDNDNPGDVDTKADDVAAVAKAAEDKAKEFDDNTDPEGTAPDDTKPDDDKKDDDEIVPDDEAIISKVLDKKLSPFTQQLQNQKTETDLAAILAQNPEYKPYEARIRRWVAHPNRAGLIKQGLPVKAVVTEALSPYLQKIGADKAKKADDKARMDNVDGTTTTPTTGKLPDFSKMNAEEFTKMSEQVKAGRFKMG